MKNYRNLVPVVLIVLFILSIYVLGDNNKKNEQEYQNYLKLARGYVEEEIYQYAIDNYIKALEIKSDIDVCIELGKCYYNPDKKMSEEDEDIYEALRYADSLVESNPKSAKAYEFCIELNYIKGNYAECYDLYDAMTKRKLMTDKVEEIIQSMEYMYEIDVFEYDEVWDFSNGYARVMRDGKEGLASSGGGGFTGCKYVKVSDFMNSVAAVKNEEDEVYFINANKKRCRNIPDDIKCEEAGLVGDNMLFTVYDGKSYSYYNYNTMKKAFGEYQYATPMIHLRAAVKENSKWYIINEKGEKISDKPYDEIVMNDKEFICMYERIFVKEGNEYLLLDLNGKQICNNTFEDVDLFNGNIAAVKVDGKWGFIDINGNFVIECQYLSARSFNNGYAAVKIDNKWGFIDEKGKVVIEPVFEDAKYFNSRGCVFIKMTDKWDVLRLYKYNH